MLDAINIFIKKLKLKKPLNQPYVICTLHRQENVEDFQRLSQIIQGLNEISKKLKLFSQFTPEQETKLILWV